MPTAGNRESVGGRDSNVSPSLLPGSAAKPKAKPPQSVLDAVSDAETLRRFVVHLPFWTWTVGVAPGIVDDLWLAEWQGNRAGTLPKPLETADQAAACARIAANAAFRAVPGLRG